MFKARSTKENPVWDYFLTISHTLTALIAYRKNENGDQHFIGLIYKLSRGYGAVNVPTECIGGCKCGGNGVKCISPAKETKLFDEAQKAVDWVFKACGMLGPIPQDLVEPPCFQRYDKNAPMNGGRWNDQIIYGNFKVADQTTYEPEFTGKPKRDVQPGRIIYDKQTVWDEPTVKPGTSKHTWERREPKEERRTWPRRDAAPTPRAKRSATHEITEVQTVQSGPALSIEEALESAQADLKKEFGFDASGDSK